jgi:hypothetical protein
MILGYLQIVHHLCAWDNPLARHHPIHSIGPQHMHAQLDLPHKQEALSSVKKGDFWWVWMTSLVLVAGLPCCAGTGVVVRTSEGFLCLIKSKNGKISLEGLSSLRFQKLFLRG